MNEQISNAVSLTDSLIKAIFNEGTPKEFVRLTVTIIFHFTTSLLVTLALV